MKRIALLLLSVMIALMPLGTCLGDTGTEIVIYHTNDIHGAFAYAEGSSIGIDRVAALKKADPGSILVDAGDATQGLPFASLTMGLDVIDVMSSVGYDMMAAGNHEFDYGTETLLLNSDAAEFPILAANVYKDGQPLLGSSEKGSNGRNVIIERKGKKIGFFGLTTADTATSTNPQGIVGIEFRDEIATAKSEIDELRAAGVDSIIAVAHIGEYGDVPVNSEKLAESMTGEYAGAIDVIIDAHSHTIENSTVNGTLIVQTGTALANVGKITLSFGADGVSANGEILSYEDMMSVEPDADISAKVDAVNESQQTVLEKKLFTAEGALWGGYIDGIADARLVETNLGDLAADAYRDSAAAFISTAAGMEEHEGKPIVGAINGGGIRASVPNGTVTKGHMVSAFPFSNTLMIKEITPSVLYQILETSVSYYAGIDAETGLVAAEPSGGFLQISGIRFEFDPAAQAGSKVLSVYLEGSDKPLDRADTATPIILVSNNFIMSGGNDYTMLADLPLIGEIGGELETIESYMLSLVDKNTGKLDTQKVQGRIVIKGDYEPDSYQMTINVVDTDGKPVANKSITCWIDGKQVGQANTDENGVLMAIVDDGPHNVKLWHSGQDIYVNNYTGAGLVETEYRQFPVAVYSDAPMPNAPTDEEKSNSIMIAVLVIAIIVLIVVVVEVVLYKKTGKRPLSLWRSRKWD